MAIHIVPIHIPILSDSSPLLVAYQELGGSQEVQVQGLDPGVVDAHLPVDPRALDADQDSQVGGEPGGA